MNPNNPNLRPGGALNPIQPEVLKVLDGAHTAMAHALTLGYCGDGSTRGMILEAIREIEKVHEDVSGGIFEDEEITCDHEFGRALVSGPFDPPEYDMICKQCGMTEPFDE